MNIGANKTNSRRGTIGIQQRFAESAGRDTREKRKDNNNGMWNSRGGKFHKEELEFVASRG